MGLTRGLTSLALAGALLACAEPADAAVLHASGQMVRHGATPHIHARPSSRPLTPAFAMRPALRFGLVSQARRSDGPAGPSRAHLAPIGRTHVGAHTGGRNAATGVGIVISGLQLGYPFSGGSNYRLNGPSILRQGQVWLPVHMVLSNGGESRVTGRLTIADDGSQNQNGNGPASYRTDYTLDVALAAGSRKAVTMYMPASDVAGQTAPSLTLSVDGQTLSTTTLSPVLQPSGVLSAGILSDDPAEGTIFRSFPKFGDTSLGVAQFGDAAPLDTQAQALDNFDLIALANYASDGLSSAQLDALRAWVRGGGTLLVAGGADAQKTMGPLPADLLAATFRSTAVAPDVPELAQVAGGAVAASGLVEYSIATPLPGARVVVAHNGVPLLAVRPLGRGHLVYSAVEPTGPPFNTWPLAAQNSFWANALLPPLQNALDALIEDQAGNTSPFAPFSNGTPNVTNDLGSVPPHTLPVIQVYVFLIILYVLALGPVNYMLLRWRRRLEWSWISVPAVAALFGLGSFGLAYARNGGSAVTNVDTVVFLDPGTPTKLADSYVGLVAPGQGDYTISTTGPGLAWGLGGDSGLPSSGSSSLGLSVDEGPQLSARLVGLQMWSQRNIALRREIALPGVVTGQLAVHGSGVGGTVTNGTGLTLHDCVVVGAGGASPVIGEIRPGSTVSVGPFSLAGNGAASGGPNNASAGPLNGLYDGASRTFASSTRYADVLNTVFPSGSASTLGAPLALIGWSGDPLGAFSVNGSTPRRTDLDLVVAPLSPVLAPGAFALAPGDLPVGVVGTSVSSGVGGANNGLTLNASDHVDVQLVLPPAQGALHVDTLTLQANLNGSSLSADGARLWNPSTGRWDAVDLSGGTATVRQAQQYVGTGGRVVLRVTATGGSSISLNNVDQNLAIGATGSIR